MLFFPATERMSLTCRQRLVLNMWCSRKHTKIYEDVAWGNSLISKQEQCLWRELWVKIPSELKALMICTPGSWVRIHYAFILELLSYRTEASNHLFGTLNGGVSSPYQVAVTDGRQCWEQNVGLHWQKCELSLVFLAVVGTEQPLGRMWFPS